jgi:hypothetical protein
MSKDNAECSGWLIVWALNKQLLGAPEYRDGVLVALDPVWALEAQLSRNPVIDPMGRPKMSIAGELQFTETVQWVVAAVLFLPSIKRLPVPAGAATYKLDDLTAQERARIVNGLHHAQQKAMEMAASDAGVVGGRLVGVKG